MEGVGCMKDVGSKREKSLFASHPLLCRTGGCDIYDHHSLLYLYSNGNQVNNSIEYLGKQVKEVFSLYIINHCVNTTDYMIELVLFADFKNDYVLSKEDNDAVNFITNRFESAVVVDIADILLTIKFQEPNINQGWIYDSVSPAAHSHI